MALAAEQTDGEKQLVASLKDAHDMAPRLVTDSEAWPWDERADVVVLGFGGAGACAAIEAREQGADVLVVDRFGGGGATLLAAA